MNKFDSMFDLNALRSEVGAMSNSQTEREEIPDGDYCASIDRMSLIETKGGFPAMRITYKINMPDSRFNNRLLFCTQVMNNAIGVNVALGILKHITMGFEDQIVFNSFTQFEELLETVKNMTEGWLYDIAYGTNARGYKTFKVNAMEVEP